LRSQIGLQFWKIWMARWKLIVAEKRLEHMSNFELKRVYVTLN
jgi:Fe-S cluster biosynthesis and repair protein YggX